ncbi:hypothetical protein FGB62_181g023 [Gracilaria domingensis]|nr:hypothetical protein FGB62_181g023 [Gracilaria domingensis]
MFSRFMLLLEYFGQEDGWYQSGLHNYDESMAAMDALASFHAAYGAVVAHGAHPERQDRVLQVVQRRVRYHPAHGQEHSRGRPAKRPPAVQAGHVLRVVHRPDGRGRAQHRLPPAVSRPVQLAAHVAPAAAPAGAPAPAVVGRPVRHIHKSG